MASWLLIVVCGCGENGFVTPPPPELTALGNADSTPPHSIELILAPESTRDNEAIGLAMRREAARRTHFFHLSRPSPGDPPERQATLIRHAASQPRPILLVEPIDSPEVFEALREVRARGTPVVAIGRRVMTAAAGSSPSSDSSNDQTTISIVDFAKDDTPIRELVGLVLRDVRATELSPDSHALIVAMDTRSPGIDTAIATIRSALESSGFHEHEIASIQGDLEKDGRLVTERVAADPRLGLVFALEVDGVNAAMAAYETLKTSRVLRMGGIMSIDSELPPAMTVNYSGMIDRNLTRLADRAFTQGLELARGVPVTDVVEIPLRLVPRPAGVHPETTDLQAPASLRK
ncbi:MAG: hypothetical protein AB7I30_01860 [Isosphaeraceae bacterium]